MTQQSSTQRFWQSSWFDQCSPWFIARGGIWREEGASAQLIGANVDVFLHRSSLYLSRSFLTAVPTTAESISLFREVSEYSFLCTLQPYVVVLRDGICESNKD